MTTLSRVTHAGVTLESQDLSRTCHAVPSRPVPSRPITKTFAFIKTLLSDVVKFQSIVEYLTREDCDGLIGFSR